MINFSSGPSYISEDIKAAAVRAIENYDNTGLSILEINHRKKHYQEIIREIKILLQKIMAIGAEWEVLLMQGGATMQFFQVPYNFLSNEDSALYIHTGTWSSKAIKEASLENNIDKISLIEEVYHEKEATDKVEKKGKYVHITTNETIEGVQFHKTPSVEVPVVADMSSDILGKKRDFNAFDLIYAGAQKNLGIAGVTLVLVKKRFLKEKQKRDLPTNQLSYKKYVEMDGIPNTPPVFAVYLLLLSLRKIEKQGLKQIQQKNENKAKHLYDCINQHKRIFLSSVQERYRSDMNIVFRLPKETMEEEFIKSAEKEGFRGIRGHRSKGGVRVSNYNNIEEKTHIIPFVQFMTHFAKTKT